MLPRRVAAFAAHCAVAAFGVAYDDWAEAPESDFATLITATANDLKKALTSTRLAEGRSGLQTP